MKPSDGPHVVDLLLDPAATAADLVADARPRGDLRTLTDCWVRGGHPEPWLRDDARIRETWMDQYVRAYVLRDYFTIAEGAFLWRSLPAFTRNVTKRVIKHAKGYLRDSGLGHHALRVSDVTALLSHPQAGASWEGMVVEEICRQLAQRGIAFDACHYRTGGGAEVDLVLEGTFGLVAIEIKLGQRVRSQELRGLREFIVEHHCRFGLVLSNEEKPRLIEENIAGLPVRYL